MNDLGVDSRQMETGGDALTRGDRSTLACGGSNNEGEKRERYVRRRKVRGQQGLNNSIRPLESQSFLLLLRLPQFVVIVLSELHFFASSSEVSLQLVPPRAGLGGLERLELLFDPRE